MLLKKAFALAWLSLLLCTSSAFAAELSEEEFNATRPVVEEPFSPEVKEPEPEPAGEKKAIEELFTPPETEPEPAGEKKAIEELFTPPETEPEPAGKENVIEEGEGLEFLMHNEDGVMAFAVIAAHEQYTLRPVLAGNKIRGVATVSQMSAELNDIAMVNGGYFAWTGNLIGLTKINGVIVSNDYFNRSAIGIREDGTAVFGRVRYEGKVIFGGTEIPVNVNSERGENSVVVFNEYFGASTGTNDFGVEIEERGGVITNIFRDKGNNSIPSGSRIISAHGTAANIFANAQIGDAITFSEEIISEEANFNALEFVLGAGPRLVTNGQVLVTADAEQFPADIRVGRAPRSAVGVTKWGDYVLAVVDGRQAQSRGCTLQEWAQILLDKFGAVDAINLDGGGSTALVVKDKLVNSPSDGSERSVGSALAIVPKQMS